MKAEDFVSIEECVQRYIAAFDELEFIGEQFAGLMGISTHFDNAKDYLEAMIEKSESLQEALQLSYDDAMPEE